MPFDRWSCRHAERVRRWPGGRSVERNQRCAASGLVRIGSHSHRHRIGATCTRDDLRAEAQHSREILRIHLGDDAARVSRIRTAAAGRRSCHRLTSRLSKRRAISLAVCTDMGWQSGGRRHWLPRIEAFELDSPAVLRAKAAGSLTPYFFLSGFAPPSALRD